jgi:hypothetical protein
MTLSGSAVWEELYGKVEIEEVTGDAEWQELNGKATLE